jgi:predicted lipid-binding transport protein (Tim44 family)
MLIRYNNQNQIVMSGLLYLIAVILIIGWVFGFFVFHVGGGLIHILLVIAIIAVLLRIIRGGNAV